MAAFTGIRKKKYQLSAMPWWNFYSVKHEINLLPAAECRIKRASIKKSRVLLPYLNWSYQIFTYNRW